MTEEQTKLNDIKSILDSLVALQTQVRGLVDSATADRGQASVLVQQYQHRLAAIEKREDVMKRKEPILCSAEELDRRRGALEQVALDLEDQKKVFIRECAAKKDALAEEQANLDILKKELDRREEVLSQEKETYKATLLRKMGRDK